MNAQLKKIGVYTAFSMCISCGFLPHSSEGVLSSQIISNVYVDKDTSAISVAASFAKVDGANGDWTYILDPNPIQDFGGDTYTLETAALNFSYSQSKKHVNFGFGALGYIGNYKSTLENGTSIKLNYYGVGMSAMVGFPLHFRKVNWNLLNLQTGFAYDFGDYTNIRPEQTFFDINDDVVGVPKNVVANQTAIYTGFDFFEGKKASFTFEIGMFIDGFIQTNNVAYTYIRVADGLLVRSTFSYDHFKLLVLLTAPSGLETWNIGVGYSF